MVDINKKSSKNNVKIVKTDNGLKNGQIKCYNCGATDIALNENTGFLKCNYCRSEFSQEKFISMETNISKLEGRVIGSGAQNIVTNVQGIITFKCNGCGAEVVIDTSETTQARCHWCRSFLSINEQIPNGSVPDVVLPFSIKKEQAEKKIKEFVNDRKFFAHPKFKREFTTNNIMGVYLPYMLVDINAHARFIGEGEHLVRRYRVDKETYYDADLYHIEREFDIIIKGLSVEASTDKLNAKSSEKTNNIINSIMPFDIDNCVVWNANYLRGYSSEKRDVNIERLSSIVNVQSKDISRFEVNTTLNHYDRGVAWEKEQLDIKGEQWKAAYLPIWLYSYLEEKGNKKMLHYVAVNARTKETMGSVPIHMPKLLFVSFLIELLGLIIMFFVDFEYNWIFLSIGVIFFLIILGKYRNGNARHTYEKETKRQMSNIKKVDDYVKRRRGLKNAKMRGANNKNINGNYNNFFS